MCEKHYFHCGSANEEKSWGNVNRTYLPIGSRNKDIDLNIRGMEGVTSPDIGLDLLEIAAYVYHAHIVTPLSEEEEFQYNAPTQRQFFFKIPVRVLGIWNQDEVKQALSTCLETLTRDKYDFKFSKLSEKKKKTRAKPKITPSPEKAPVSPEFEEVMFLSGGIDSLSGVIQEVIEGHHKVLLVSHTPSAGHSELQTELFQSLTEKLDESAPRPHLVTADIKRRKTTYQIPAPPIQSFLFAALGAMIARSIGLDKIRFAVNGITSINLPYSDQVIDPSPGAFHPAMLSEFGEFFSLIFEQPFSIENIYLQKTKANLLKKMKTVECDDLYATTISCSQNADFKSGTSHCGRCLKCLERWISAIAEGFDSTEDSDAPYERDVLFDGLDEPGYLLMERYIGRARQVLKIETAADFLKAFPEEAQAISQGALSAQQIFHLHKSHAKTVINVMSSIISDHSGLIALHDYPANSLLSLALVPKQEQAGRVEFSENDNKPSTKKSDELIIHQGNFSVEFQGHTCDLSNTKEFKLISYLNDKRIRFKTPVYCPNSEILQAVWEVEGTYYNRIQRVASNLRIKLRDAEIKGVEIDGQTNQGHYALIVESEVADAENSD